MARWSEYQLGRKGCLERITNRPSHAITPSYVDLWFLYRLVRMQKPRCLFEFGSGCSTLVLAQAVWDNGQGFLYSLDSEDYWAEVTRQTLLPHQRSVCEVKWSPVEETEYLGTPGFRYSWVPDEIPEFIYLDGPALTPTRQVSVNVLELEERFQIPFCLVVDGRWLNAMFLKRHLKHRYHFTPRWRFGNSVFELINS